MLKYVFVVESYDILEFNDFKSFCNYSGNIKTSPFGHLSVSPKGELKAMISKKIKVKYNPPLNLPLNKGET